METLNAIVTSLGLVILIFLALMCFVQGFDKNNGGHTIAGALLVLGIIHAMDSNPSRR